MVRIRAGTKSSCTKGQGAEREKDSWNLIVNAMTSAGPRG